MRTPTHRSEGDDREALRCDPLGLVARRAAEPGLPRVWLGASSAVLVARPERVRAVLVERAEQVGKPEFLRASNRGRWGEGLTTLEGERWRERRVCLRGVFAEERVQAHRAVARACARRMVEGWRIGDEVDLRHALRQLTAACAVRFVLGAEVEGWGASLPGCAGVVPWAEAYGEDFTAVATGDVPLALTRPRAPMAMPVTLRIIDEALARAGDGDGSGDDALTWLVAHGTGLGRDAIVDELVQMLFAGHHTVPTTLLALVRVLAREPMLAQQLRDEAAPSTIEQVIQETLRRFPPASILYREVIEPFELEGEPLEAGTGVWVCTQVLHHDPRSFPEPERFEPERFGPQARARIPAYAYLPFGAGPRICAASRLAMAQMVESCAVIVGAVALRPCGGDRFVVERAG
jgi:enediyne biosynthesis protein E7